MEEDELLTTGELARKLRVSHSAILKWVREKKITPEITTPGGHHRWLLADVRRQLRELQQTDDG